LVDGQRYYVIDVSSGGMHRYQLASSMANAQDGIAIHLMATDGTGGIKLQQAVNTVDASGSMATLDIAELTEGYGLTNNMLSITVAGAAGKRFGGAGAVSVSLSSTTVSAAVDNSGLANDATDSDIQVDAGALSVAATDNSQIIAVTVRWVCRGQRARRRHWARPSVLRTCKT